MALRVAKPSANCRSRSAPRRTELLRYDVHDETKRGMRRISGCAIARRMSQKAVVVLTARRGPSLYTSDQAL